MPRGRDRGAGAPPPPLPHHGPCQNRERRADVRHALGAVRRSRKKVSASCRARHACQPGVCGGTFPS